jgi:cutinase
MVLDGYSQGAAVIDMVTEELPPEVAGHVAEVAVFGNPKSTFARGLGAASFLQSARSTAPRRLTRALPTTESALRARTRPHIIYMLRTG